MHDLSRKKKKTRPILVFFAINKVQYILVTPFLEASFVPIAPGFVLLSHSPINEGIMSSQQVQI